MEKTTKEMKFTAPEKQFRFPKEGRVVWGRDLVHAKEVLAETLKREEALLKKAAKARAKAEKATVEKKEEAN